MPTAVYQAPPPTDRDEADGGYRRQRDRQLHTQFTPSSMSTPQATSPPYQQPAMQWPPPYHGGPPCAAGAESMRAPSHQHQWTTSPYQSTGIPTSARLSQAHSTAPVTVPVTVPFPPAHAVPPPVLAGLVIVCITIVAVVWIIKRSAKPKPPRDTTVAIDVDKI